MTELMTLEEVANYLRVTTKTIYRMLDKQAIPATKVGRQWRFDKASIDIWLRQMSVEKAANILVIDDDEEICSLFKDTLEESGHTVTTANESSEGLELVNNQDYDLVFLDLKMPVMDGAELFRQIRLAKPKLPVTIITGYPDSDLMMNALTHGPLGVMGKPFSGSDILAAVDNYLRFGMSTK
jgi:excisionase family DNA binding protein